MVDDTTLENRSKPAEGDKKIAAPDQHNFWNNTEYGATDKLPSLFANELTEEQLLKDPRWIKASREIYKLNNKDDPTALTKLEYMSDAEIAQEGLSYYGQFNYNMANMAYETAQFVKDASPEQKKAFLFMMDAYDHKNQSLAGWGRAIGNMLWDPTTYVGLGTFGVGVAAREGAKTAAKTSLKEVLKKAVATGLTAEVKTELKNNAALQTVKAGAKIGAIEGGFYTTTTDALQQKIEMDTMAANGTLINDFRSGNFSFSRLLEHAGYGAAFGGGIGGTAPVAISAIGKRLKSIFGFNASPALKEVTALHGEKVILNADGTIRSINGEAVKPGRFFLDADNEVMPNLAMAGGNDSPPVGNVPTPEGGNNTGRQGQGTTINNYSGPVTINNYNGPAPSGQATPAPHTQGAAAEQVQPASKPTESKVATEASEPVTSAQKEVPKQESTTEQVSPSDNQITVLETTKGPDGTHRHDPQTQPDDSAGQEMPLHDGDGELLRNPEEKQKQRSAAGQQTQTGPSGSDGPPGEPATPPPDAGQAPNNTGGTGPSPTGKLIPLPKRTWWHTAAYVLSIPRRLPWIGDNAADASKFLPNDLAFGKYIKGVIKGIDEKIVGNNLVESFKKLEKDMEILSLRAHDPSNGITVEVAKAESIKIIKAFVDAHHKDLKKFSADINPIIDELELEHGIAKVFEDANRNEGGYAFGKREGNGKAGQLKIDELIARYNEKWPGTLDASYAKKMESNFKNGTKGYFRLKASQAQAMLDYARDLRDVSTRLAKVQDGNPDFLELYKKDFTSILEGKTDSASVADALKKSLWEIKKLTGNTNQELSSNAEQRLKDMPRTEGMARVKALAKWLWPNWLGGGNSRSNYLENLEAQQRMFDIGYYNRHRRITPIVKGDEMDNLERIAIQIEALNSKDPKTVETKIEGFIRISYALGREWEGMKALQRLQWMIGKKPDNQVAENIKSTLTNRPRREDERTLDKFHSGEYLSLVHDKAGEAAALILHSPQTYSQRDVLRIYTEFSNIFWHGRRFAGAGEVAAPFTKYHYIMFKERLKNNFWSYISGGTTLDNPNFDPLKEPGTGNLPYHNKWNFGLRWGAKPADMSSFQHLMTNAPVWYAVPFRAVTFPLVPGYLLTKQILGNNTFKTVTKTLLKFGAPLAILEEGAELLPDAAKPDWATNEKGNFVVPGTNIDLDIGSRFFLAPAIYLADLTTTPMRANIAALQWSTKKLTDVDPLFGFNPWNLSLNNDYFSLSDINSGAMALPLIGTPFGDRGEPNEKKEPENPETKQGGDPNPNPVQPSPAASGDTTSSSPHTPAPPPGGGGNGSQVEIRQHSGDTQPPANTGTTAQDAAIKEKKEALAKLDAQGDNITLDDAVIRENLKQELEQLEEAKKRAAAQAQAKKDGKPEGAVMTPLVMRNQLEKDKAYIEKSAIDHSDNNNIKGRILADIDSAIAGLGSDNPSAAAKDAALKQMARINEIRTNYDNLDDAIFNLGKFEKFVNESGADKTTLAEIKDVRDHLRAGKVDPNYAVDALKYAKKFHDNHNWDETKYNSGKALKSVWDGLKTTEFEDPNNPLYGTLNHSWNAAVGFVESTTNSGMGLWGDITSGKKGSKWQTATKFAGGLVGAWVAMSYIGEWIDQTPILNIPGIKQLLKLALFVGILMGGAKLMESFMDTKAAIQTDKDSRHVPSSFTDTKYNIKAREGNKPESSGDTEQSVELGGGSASTQSHSGKTPKTVALNKEENAVVQALIENTRDASGSASQGSGTHVAREFDNGAYVKMGGGDHFPVKDPLFGHGVLGREQIPHNDNADSTPLEKTLVMAGLRTPGYALAGPTLEMR